MEMESMTLAELESQIETMAAENSALWGLVIDSGIDPNEVIEELMGSAE